MVRGQIQGLERLKFKHRTLLLQLRPGATEDKKRKVLEEWYRHQLKAEVPPLIEKWERLIGVKAERFHVQRKKTKWGSCSPDSSSIRPNTELAKKPRECLEYIVVHELIHLLEPTHNARFVALIDHYLPKWQSGRQLLNRLPVRHESWGVLTCERLVHHKITRVPMALALTTPLDAQPDIR